MREILFRGKRVKKYCKEQDWTEGVPYIDHEDDCIMATHYSKYVVDPETVGQYTGLTDKNGKKIFEGDIIKIYLYETKRLANYETGCIKYDDTKARFVLCTEEGNYGIDNSNVFEVIGNIHDNPELLKEGGE